MRGLSGWLAVVAVAVPAPVAYPVVRPGIVLAFPTDHGAHPAFRTEWWYVTGWLRTAAGEDIGFQVTFFRTRPPVDQANPSRFAARQVLFAHAALSDPETGRLLHGERAAREGFGLAAARTGDADIGIRDWHLRRVGDGRWATRVIAKGFALALDFRPTQPPLPQGAGGYSRKGPRHAVGGRHAPSRRRRHDRARSPRCRVPAAGDVAQRRDRCGLPGVAGGERSRR